MNSGVDTSASGIEEGRFEGVSPVFTEVHLISEGDINILGKGKRYGRWWLLKGLQPDLSELTQYVEMLHKEFELLTFLAEHPNHVFSKAELFHEIWKMDSVGDIATVTVHIKKIREKIEFDTSKPQYIETIWGVGYRFKI